MAKLLFAANDGSTGAEFYVLDSETDLITSLGDFNPGPQGSFTDNEVAVVNGEFLFPADNGVVGQELFATDGTPEGIRLVEDIEFGPTSSIINIFAEAGDRAFFQVINNSAVDDELFVTDGTAEGTFLTRDLNPGTGSGLQFLRPFGDDVLFQGNNGVTGVELYISDGTESGTRLVRDINPGAGSSNLFIGVNTDEDILDGELFFSATNGQDGAEVFVTDGTMAGTVQLIDLNPGAAGSNPQGFLSAGDQMFFSATNGNAGRELFISDGTESGTRLLRDINAGAGGSNPILLAALDDVLIFAADDGFTGRELYVSDGTQGGTQLLRDINPGGNGSNPSVQDPTLFAETAIIDGQLYFTAVDASLGRELYVTDGTVGGTRLVSDINPGVSSSDPRDFVVVGDSLYFAADDGERGREIYKSDGTEAGTLRVSDIDPGADSSNPRLLAVLQDAPPPPPTEVTGTAGDDVIPNGAGDELIDGLAGFDTVVYATPRAEASIVQNADGTLTVASATETDVLTDVERLRFTDETLDFGEREPNDPVDLGAGDDRFVNQEGDDQIDGGAGFDTVVYPVARAATSVDLAQDGTVTVEQSGETDVLTDVERVEFDQGALRFDFSDEGPLVYRLYAAAFARTPDEGGLAFNINRADAGASDRALSVSFVESVEFGQKFGTDITDQEFIDALYNNVLQRDADPGGSAFWLEAFSSGRLDQADMLLAFSESPENVDRTAPDIDDGFFVL